MAELSWKTKTVNLVEQYNSLISDNPNIPLRIAAKELNSNPATICRALKVHKYLDNPAVTNAKSLKEAYDNVKDHNHHPSMDEIKDLATQIWENQ